MNKKNPEISVIVPVYKVEKYLSQCIESILAQSFMDFELLLIDDGSPDCCGKICDEYAGKDGRIRVFHQKNAGVSVARNRGLNEAEGRYVTFVDSDDYVLPDYLLDLYNALPDKNRKGVVVETVTKLYSSLVEKPCPLPDLIFSQEEYYRLLTELYDKNLGYSASKLYNMKIIQTYQLSFLSELSLLEDLLFFLDYIRYSDFIAIRNISNYVYRVGHSEVAQSVYYRTPEQEYVIFQHYYSRIVYYQKIYGLQFTELKGSWHTLTVFFHRIILSMYGDSVSFSCKARIAFLRKIVSCNCDWIRKGFLPDYLADRIGKFLLINHLYYCFDIWMRGLLSIHFRYMFGAKKL